MDRRASLAMTVYLHHLCAESPTRPNPDDRPEFILARRKAILKGEV
jgi:hypothetical protein